MCVFFGGVDARVDQPTPILHTQPNPFFWGGLYALEEVVVLLHEVADDDGDGEGEDHQGDVVPVFFWGWFVYSVSLFGDGGGKWSEKIVGWVND